jgi:membrane associated rhomboid family serine protease
VRAIVAVEVGVFAMWMYGRSTSPTTTPTTMAHWMNDNFVLSWRNVDAGRWWTVVTCNLSHNNPLHLLLNVSFTLTLGRVLSMLALRPLAQFGSLALATSLAASAAFLAQTKPRRDHHHALAGAPAGAAPSMGALGASGMNSGFLAATACMVPRLQLNLFGVVPLRVWQIALFCAAVDAYFLEAHTGIGHSAHLGGAVAGAAWWAVFRRALPRVMIP